MDHFRSGHRKSSGMVIATLGNEHNEGIAQCNLMELTTSWERQNHVYVHFKSVTGTPRPKALVAKQPKVESKPCKTFIAVLKGIF